MKKIIIDIISFICGMMIIILLFALFVIIYNKCLEYIMLLWPGYEDFTYLFILSGLCFLLFSIMSIIIATFFTIYQFYKGKIKEKFDIFVNYFGGIAISFWIAVGMFVLYIIWVMIYGFVAQSFRSYAKEYIDEQYRKYNKIPRLFTKRKICVTIKSETKKIYNDTELKHYTTESQIENDDNIIECNPYNHGEWHTDPVSPEDMWVNLTQPVKIDFYIEIYNNKQKVSKNNEYHVNLDFDDFENGKTYTIESILSDKKNCKAKFITTYTFELDLPIQIAKDYINPFKEIEFVTIGPNAINDEQ